MRLTAFVRDLLGALPTAVTMSPVNLSAFIESLISMLCGMPASLLSNAMVNAVLAGNAVGAESKPYATVYGGHQFGHWAGQLGDGGGAHRHHEAVVAQVLGDHQHLAALRRR